MQKGKQKELEIYIHIPFCVRKCAYCDFLSGPADEETVARYVRKLTEEIGAQGAFGYSDPVTSVFFGGGTPSLLGGPQVQRILDALREAFSLASDAEISLEANPGTVTEEKLRAYRKAGINRLSFGLQSADPAELKRLGRIHTYEDFLDSFSLARACGFENINVDLMFAIPGQTKESWEKSLVQTAALGPEHISAYSLIIEDGTPFALLYGQDGARAADLPGEEEERLMYRRTEEILREAGYHRYEISNYAKDGRECRHNLGYWERKNYLGIGLGASGLMENVRYKNTSDLRRYLSQAGEAEAVRAEEERLTVQEQMEESIFLGLRKMQGISARGFADTFGRTLKECYGENIERMIHAGLLEEKDGFLRLTKRGIDVSNYVFAEILR